MSKVTLLDMPRNAKVVIADLSNAAPRIESITAVVTYKDGTHQVLTDDKTMGEMCYHAAILQNEVQYLISTSYENDA